MSEGPDINPVFNPKHQSDQITLHEAIILKQFIEKGIRTEEFFLPIERCEMEFLRLKLENIIEVVKLKSEKES